MTIDEYRQLKPRPVAPPPNVGIVFDVDGTIRTNGEFNPGRHWHILNYSEVDWIRNAQEGMLLAYDFGFHILWASNQTGIGEGLASEKQIIQVFQQMRMDMVRYISKRTIQMDNTFQVVHSRIGYLFCKHHPDSSGCGCMKPKPGLVLAHAMMYDLDLNRSFMIGNEGTDIVAGIKAGIPKKHCILVDNYTDKFPTTLEAVEMAIRMANCP